MHKLLILLGLLPILLSGISVQASELTPITSTYSSTIGFDRIGSKLSGYTEYRFLYLPVKINKNCTIYEDTALAINILAIVVDGNEIKGREQPIGHDSINTDKVTPLSGNYIYKLDLNHLYFAKAPAADLVASYNIPRGINSITIKYSFTYTDGSESPDIYLLKAESQ